MIFETKTPEYYEWIQSLQYLSNKKDFIKEDSFIIHRDLLLLIPHLEKDTYPYYISIYGYYMIISLPNGKSRGIYKCNYGLNTGAIHKIFTDKIVCAEFLLHNNIQALTGHLLLGYDSIFSHKNNNIESAIQFAEQNGYPLYLKPVKGTLGRGIKKVYSKNELLKFIGSIDINSPYMLQKEYHGNDYRVLYLNGEILVAYQRIHPSIIGNGKNTIEDLIASTKAYEIEKESVIEYIQQQGLLLNKILEVGIEIQILPTANASRGGSVKVYTKTTQADIVFMQNIAAKTGSDYFGADILTSGSIHEGVVLELNSTPCTHGIISELAGFEDFYSFKIRKAIKESEGIVD